MVMLLAILCVLLLVTLVLVVLFDEERFDSSPSAPSVLACDKLRALLATGRISPAEYRRQLGTLSADEDRRSPLHVPRL